MTDDTIQALIKAVGPITPGQQAAQRESYAEGYKPGPRQAHLLRTPTPPERLVEALGDCVHREVGNRRLRASRTTRTALRCPGAHPMAECETGDEWCQTEGPWFVYMRDARSWLKVTDDTNEWVDCPGCTAPYPKDGQR